MTMSHKFTHFDYNVYLNGHNSLEPKRLELRQTGFTLVLDDA